MKVKTGDVFLIGGRKAEGHFYSHAVGLVARVVNDPPEYGSHESVLLQVDWHQPGTSGHPAGRRISNLYIQPCDLLPLPNDKQELSRLLLSGTLEQERGDT